MTLSAIEINSLKHAPAVEGVLPVIHERWSSRAFADRDVSPINLARVFEAARWAASSNNEQPWRFFVGVRNSETHKKMAACLMGFNQAWAAIAPVLILGVASTKFSHNGSSNSYAQFDLGAASSYLTLQAAALGMTTHQMAGFNHDALREALGIPESYALGTLIALGYQGEPGALGNEQLIAREVAPRTRKPMKEMVFTSWEEPADLA